MRTERKRFSSSTSHSLSLPLSLHLQTPFQPSEARRSESGVLGKPTEDVSSLFVLGRVLGKGQFGTTRLAEERSTGRQLACKSIAKRKLTTPEDVEDVRREVQIMHHLRGCPHVVTLHGAYEDKHNVHLIMVRKEEWKREREQEKRVGLSSKKKKLKKKLQKKRNSALEASSSTPSSTAATTPSATPRP